MNDLPKVAATYPTPGAGGVDPNSEDARADAVARGSTVQSSGPARFLSTPESRAAGRGPFTCAYWDYMRRIRLEEPLAADHGLEEIDAEAIRRQCHYNFDQRLHAQAKKMLATQKPSVKGPP